jgi:Domain of unknown function DUF302
VCGPLRPIGRNQQPVRTPYEIKRVRAAAAKKFGLEMRPRTVIVFGNPKLGTPAMVKTPLLAIDVPPKALVWEDDQGKVWLSYNSSDYLYNTIYPRHGATVPPATAPFARSCSRRSRHARRERQ